MKHNNSSAGLLVGPKVIESDTGSKVV